MSSALDDDIGSRRLAHGDMCASIFELPEIRKPQDGGGAAVKAEERNACSTSSFPSSPSCSSSSSIGKNSDLDHSASSSEVGDGGGEDEVQSQYKGTLDSVNDLEEALPFRRGISRFYNGKSKSFTSLAAASSSPCIKEIAKPENAYTRKRKNLLAFSQVWEKKGGNFKRPLHLSRSTVALAVAMGSSDSISDASSDSNSSSNAVSPTATALPPLHPQAKLSCSPWRSFSVADLQQCSGGTAVNVNMYGGGCYSFFK